MEDEKDLEEYLTKVRLELSERESKLAGVEKEIAEIEFKLKESRSGKSYLQGSAAKIISGESFRSRLRLELERKVKHRKLLQEEVSKAREREKDVESELLAEINEDD